MNANYKNKRFVYFMGCPVTQLVKIGQSDNPANRISFLQVEYGVDFHPLFYLKSIPTVNYEHEIHKLFHNYRVDYPIKINGYSLYPQGYTEWFDFLLPGGTESFAYFLLLMNKKRILFSKESIEYIRSSTKQARELKKSYYEEFMSIMDTETKNGG